jgi:hypothetical protein
MFNMTEPRCLIEGNVSRSLFQDVFVRLGNGFVGTEELLVAGSAGSRRRVFLWPRALRRPAGTGTASCLHPAKLTTFGRINSPQADTCPVKF